MFKSLFAILVVLSVSVLQTEGKRRHDQNPVYPPCVIGPNFQRRVTNDLLREILRTLQNIERMLNEQRRVFRPPRPTYPMGGNRPPMPGKTPMPGRPSMPGRNVTSKAELFEPECPGRKKTNENPSCMGAKNVCGFPTEKPSPCQLVK